MSPSNTADSIPSADECLVSVVIPAYNASAFIDRTLQSAVDQTHRAIEIVVIDDGSTDDTAAKIRWWARRDDRIRLLSTPNRGVARARNLGIDDARGAFIAFLDADDLWHRDKLRLQLDCLLDSPVRLGGCYALTRSIDADDRVLADGPQLVASGYILARHLSTHLVRNGSCLLVRRTVALELGGFDPAYAARGVGGCEDLDFEFKLAARYLVGVVPQYLVGYRQYPGNMSSDRLRMMRAMKATVAAHLAANPAIPTRVRRYAWAKVDEYCLWNTLSEKKLLAALVAAARIAVVDSSRTLRIVQTLGKRSALYFGLYRPSLVATAERLASFHDLNPEPGAASAQDGERRLLDRLAGIDAALWSDLQQQAFGAASPDPDPVERQVCPC